MPEAREADDQNESIARREMVHNERVKLVASALNTLATFTLSGGVIAPAIAAFWNIGPQPADLSVGSILAGSLVWLFAASGFTSPRQLRPWELESAMISVQAYILYVAPLVLLGAGLLLFAVFKLTLGRPPRSRP